MSLTTIPHKEFFGLPHSPRAAGLLGLLAYASRHAHSRAWIAPLTRLLQREGVRHG